jgi:hypothetical protein
MRLGSVRTGESRVFHVCADETFSLSRPEFEFLRAGRSLLLLDDLAELLFIPATGDAVVLSANVESYEVDPSGCVVAVVTAEADAGTPLTRLSKWARPGRRLGWCAATPVARAPRPRSVGSCDAASNAPTRP